MEEEELNQELTLTFEGSDGKRYRAKASEAKELAAAAAEEGVTLKGVMDDEVRNAEPEKWWSWKNLGEGVKGLWDDPTGEHGALAYMGLNLASGILTAAGKVVGGMIKGAGDVGYGLARGVARGVETLMGEDDHTVSGILEDAHDTFSDWFTMPDVFEKRGMYDGIEGARETMGMINQYAEMAFAMKGMGLASKGAGAMAGAWLGKGAKAATQSARIGQAVVAAGMGGKTYAEMAADPYGPGGWRQEAAAAAAGGLEALTWGLMAPFKKMNMALPKPFEARTRMEIAKRFAGECLKSGAMMALVEAEKKGAEALATVGTDKRWHPETLEQALKSVGSQFIVGLGFHSVGALGKTGAYLKWRGGEKGKDVALSFQVEQNRKIYAPRLNEQAELALRAREVGAQWLESGMEGTENVKRVLPSGAVEFNDGSVWQMGRDGRATITVSDGTILDARTGAVEGMRANREAAAPEETGSGSGDSIAAKRAENAGLFLDLLEQGKLPTVAQPLEGLQVKDWSYKKGTTLDGEWDQAKAPPVIVWVGNDGTRVLVTGQSRAAEASRSGAKEIKAVEVREDQGWSREQAESLDAVENMREGRGTREEIARGRTATDTASCRSGRCWTRSRWRTRGRRRCAARRARARPGRPGRRDARGGSGRARSEARPRRRRPRRSTCSPGSCRRRRPRRPWTRLRNWPHASPTTRSARRPRQSGPRASAPSGAWRSTPIRKWWKCPTARSRAWQRPRPKDRPRRRKRRLRQKRKGMRATVLKARPFRARGIAPPSRK